jgi:hypothetical protein
LTERDGEVTDSLAADESWTPTAKLKLPAAVGCPETVPELALMLTPVGNDPVATDQWYGATPPVAMREPLYASPTCPLGREVAEI